LWHFIHRGGIATNSLSTPQAGVTVFVGCL
jgi:hypothetical protein